MNDVLSLEDLKVKGKKVLMRVDFNVPLDAEGNISDDTRIREALPSIRYVLDHGGSLILLSHMGRPKGLDKSLSLKVCRDRLAELLGRKVLFAQDCVGKEAKELAQKLKVKEVLLLENLRFHEAEEKPEKDPQFVKKLAELGDLYVDDAFGSSHRAHSSITELAKEFKGKAAAGFLMEKEIEYLKDALTDPERPYLALIGGSKISSKIGVLKSLLDHVDGLLIGGAMAYTFLKARGVKIGSSLCEDDLLGEAKEIADEARKKNVPLYLPVDHVAVKNLSPEAERLVFSNQEGIPDGMMGVDIGPKTIAAYIKLISKAKTIFWNGPFGIFEIGPFAFGTFEIAKAVADSAKVSIVGGGDTVAALKALRVTNRIKHISTGGGASLELIEAGTLPGIEVLKENIKKPIENKK